MAFHSAEWTCCNAWSGGVHTAGTATSAKLHMECLWVQCSGRTCGPFVKATAEMGVKDEIEIEKYIGD